jgi:hypothetical protein
MPASIRSGSCACRGRQTAKARKNPPEEARNTAYGYRTADIKAVQRLIKQP